MGYTSQLPYQQLTINSLNDQTGHVVNAAAGNLIIEGNFSLPTFTQGLTHAYLDIHVGGVNNLDAANTNYLLSNGSFKLYETATFNAYTAGSFRNIALATQANSWSYGWTICGTTNLVTTVPASYWNTKPWKMYFYQIQANSNSLELYSVYGTLRLYFGVN